MAAKNTQTSNLFITCLQLHSPGIWVNTLSIGGNPANVNQSDAQLNTAFRRIFPLREASDASISK
jgi:hypothetical protein